MSSEIVLYTSPGRKVKIEVLFEGETVLFTQKQMAELFQKDVW